MARMQPTCEPRSKSCSYSTGTGTFAAGACNNAGPLAASSHPCPVVRQPAFSQHWAPRALRRVRRLQLERPQMVLIRESIRETEPAKALRCRELNRRRPRLWRAASIPHATGARRNDVCNRAVRVPVAAYAPSVRVLDPARFGLELNILHAASVHECELVRAAQQSRARHAPWPFAFSRLRSPRPISVPRI